MKRALLICLLVCGPALAYDVKVVDQGTAVTVITNKYTLNGNPVWDDADKAKMLAMAVNTGSGTIVDTDFIPVVVPQADLDIIAALGKGYATRSSVLSEIDNRKTKAYCLDKMTDIRAQQSVLIDMKISTSATQVEYNKWKVAYDAAAK